MVSKGLNEASLKYLPKCLCRWALAVSARLHQCFYFLSQPTLGHWTAECSSRRRAHQTRAWQCFQSVGVLHSLSLSIQLTLIRSSTRHPYGLASTHCGLTFCLDHLTKKKIKKKSNINKTKPKKNIPADITNALITTSPSPLCFRGLEWGREGGGGQLLRKRRVNLLEHTLSGLSWSERCIKCAAVMLPYKTARCILAQRGMHQFHPRRCPPDSPMRCSA